ncbi:MAG: hypothetical protein EBS01_01525 [Verrucomicrobia bacterium]|nr:hypothetical protein [Verrucomicrobiota bacterium]
MDASVQRPVGRVIGADYPAPVVDARAALKAAKDRMYGLRKTEKAREEASDVQERHGSRKSGLPPSTRGRATQARRKPPSQKTSSIQGELFE